MKQFLFRSKLIRASIIAGVIAVLPVSAASADSTSLFASLQGTSLLGTPVPVLGTQGWTVTLPVAAPVPQSLLNVLDFTVLSDVRVGNVQILNLDLDPHMKD